MTPNTEISVIATQSTKSTCTTIIIAKFYLDCKKNGDRVLPVPFPDVPFLAPEQHSNLVGNTLLKRLFFDIPVSNLFISELIGETKVYNIFYTNKCINKYF